jgi:threonine dehydrogenase-like Zn-dependent dehydrogenase
VQVLADSNSVVEVPVLVLECSGTGSGFQSACHLVGKGGEVVLVGVPRKVIGAETAGTLLEIFNRQLTVTSGLEWRLPLKEASSSGASILRNIEIALDWLLKSKISTKGMAISVSPHDAKYVFESLAEGADSLSYIFDWR